MFPGRIIRGRLIFLPVVMLVNFLRGNTMNILRGFKFFLIILVSVVLFGCDSLPECADMTAEKNDCTGQVTYTNGNTYDGEWKNNKKNGQGTYVWPSGREYIGAWKNGDRAGQGTMTVSDGTKYVGTWKDDAYLLGTMTQANGGIYEGPFVDGVYAGTDTFTFGSGKKYVGEFMNGFFEGQGTTFYTDGTERSGNFVRGEYQVTAAEKKAKLVRQFPYYAVITCGAGQGHINIQMCFKDYGSMEIRNGSDYGLYKMVEIIRGLIPNSKERREGLIVDLRESFEIKAVMGDGGKYFNLGVKVLDRSSDEILFQKQVSSYQTIRVSN